MCAALLTLEKGGEAQIQIECPPCCRGNRQEAYYHEEAKEICHDYYNYKGFFSLVLLALVDTEYRFLWVDVGSSESSSYAHTFYRSD